MLSLRVGLLLFLFAASSDDDALSLSDPLDELEETDALRLDLRLERLDFLCLRLDLERLCDDSLRRDECLRLDLRLDEDLAARDDFLLLRFRLPSESLSEDDDDDSELLLCGDGERFFGATFFSDVFMGTGLGISAQMLNEMASRSRLRSSKKLSVSSFWKRLLYDW